MSDSGLKSRDRGYPRHKGSLIKLLNIHCCDFGRSCDACNCVRAKCKGEKTSSDLGEIGEQVV
jgi:hypothetical protein